MNITLLGRIPSKKNSVVIFVRGGKLFKMPSNAYRVWHKVALQQLSYPKTLPAITRADIEILFYAPDARKTDLTNKAESIMDLLVDAGILVDDNWNVVQNLNLRFGGIDRKNPRAELIITKI